MRVRRINLPKKGIFKRNDSVSDFNLWYPGFKRILFRCFETEPTFNASAKTITLEAGCFAVIGTANIAGIEDTVADNANVIVRGEVGRIVIEGEYENAEVYSVSGMLHGTLEVPAGIYIVRVDGQAFKVVVK